MSSLERRYARLLCAYPAAYRAERGDEMLDTLMEAAPDAVADRRSVTPGHSSSAGFGFGRPKTGAFRRRRISVPRPRSPLH
jgi:hypothetical protein